MIVRVVSSDSPVDNVGNSFDVSKIITVDMGMFPPSAAYRGYTSLIIGQISNISSATTLTLRDCRDTLGDQMIITDTTSNIFTGLTTATKGTAIWALNAFVGLEENDQLHVFLKTNNGTCDVDFVEITWGDNK